MRPDVQSDEGVAVYWWDDAVRFAQQLARDTGMRHRVFAGRYGWTIAPARPRTVLRVVK